MVAQGTKYLYFCTSGRVVQLTKEILPKVQGLPYARRKVQKNQERLKLNRTHWLLDYANDRGQIEI
jgi:hypothetical protein